MELAIQQLILILGGFMLGNWLHQQFGIGQYWSIIFALAGCVLGIMLMYKQSLRVIHEQEHHAEDKEKAKEGEEKSTSVSTSKVIRYDDLPEIDLKSMRRDDRDWPDSEEFEEKEDKW